MKSWEVQWLSVAVSINRYNVLVTLMCSEGLALHGFLTQTMLDDGWPRSLATEEAVSVLRKQ